MKALILLSATLLVSGCSTLPVHGKLGSEKFLGYATGFLGGSGTITITGSEGLACEGKFKYNNPLSPASGGAGTMECQDGQSGNFVYTSDGYSGRGFGKTNNGQEFSFVFGNAGIESSHVFTDF